MTSHPPTVHDPAEIERLGLALQLVAGVYASPGDALRADLASGAFQEAVATLARATGLDAPRLEEPAWTTLQSSHVDLFVSSGRGLTAPPYVGHAVDGELLGPTARRVKAFYDQHGIVPDASWGDLPDHVAAVAEAALLVTEAGRPDASLAALDRFVAPWLERYADAIEATDVSGFYGPMTRFLRAAIREVTRETAATES